MTSVKNFRIEREPTQEDLGLGAFEFTDDYSVFDWGKMPDEIPDKGAALCSMGAFNFERLEAADLATHYRGVFVEEEIVDLETAIDRQHPPQAMAIDLTIVPDLPFHDGTYDYDAYFESAGIHYLIPLEIVFRNEVPVGSSLRNRLSPADVGLDFEEWPEEAIQLPEAIVEFSTKYEKQDRYLDRAEADQLAGQADLDELEAVARQVNDIVTEQANGVGLDHQDGKIECFYYDGEIRVADVVGTFDENRFSYEGQQLSKEVIRQYHKRTQPAWVEAVGMAKKRAKDQGVADWKSLCDRDPAPLDSAVIDTARDMYCAGTNTYLGQPLFEAPSLSEAIEAIHSL